MIALLVTVAAAVALLALRNGNSANRPSSPRQTQAMEAAALARLALPKGYVRLSHGCAASRCYVVGQPATRVAAALPGLMRGAGIKPPGQLRSAEPIAQLRSAHWVTGSNDPLVIACKTVAAKSGWHEPVCQDAGRVGPTLVNVLVEPYQPCHRPSCTQLGRSEVLAWAVAFPKAT